MWTRYEQGWMVCLNCPTRIPVRIQNELSLVIMFRSVSTGPTPIPFSIPIPIPRATVPNFGTDISTNTVEFNYDFASESS